MPDVPVGAVLVLHGGRSEDTRAPGRVNAPGLRMRPFGTALLRATRDQGVAVAEARYRRRGWNGGRADAAVDAAAALDRLAARTGGAPAVLLGHSMGGRAALRAAGRPGVAGVVALAPWCPPGEPVAHLAGRSLVFAHAEGDRVTSPADALRMAAEARAAGALVCRYVLSGGDHTMLRRARDWHRLAVLGVCGLLGVGPLPDAAAEAFALPPDDASGGLALPFP
ncbi:alpha/beta fold hydrolase [Actinacidiphila yeochonensis]|uniref:alpha/beta fold hydrolase n=1 Tax=Actinacidiphila yeochonensis TaxID=89050 RepID=UPI00068BA525|nr:alpha/beta fold hydrolase [Actinacidiphila yeochonensis]